MGVLKETRPLMGKRGQRTLQTQGCWEEGPRPSQRQGFLRDNFKGLNLMAAHRNPYH